ncbi:pitrilysin family protein [Limnobacter sp.]|uniref:M16 family metallopeptidase n=1 Tax=Limnobacter sp. TaxID=2003368 RepID=UPI00258A747C|nr:pitrilysin family protein [Limnobacter sp.]
MKNTNRRLSGPGVWSRCVRGVQVVAMVAVCALGATQVQAADGDITQYKLSNGLRLVVKEDHRAPTVAHMVWYKIGAIDEFNGTTGVSHALEHMMFKGTKKLKPGDFSKIVAGLGGQENAFTSRDYTAYFQQIQAKNLKRMMELEADRMHNLQVLPAEFKKEIQVVMEERRMRTEDQAQAKLYEAFLATAFEANPARRPVIGWMNDLEHMTASDVANWYHNWYEPNNAVVVVAGDVNPAQVKKWADETYGQIKAGTLPDRKPQEEPKQEGVRRVEVRAPAENPYVLIGFKVPKLEDVAKDRDPYALDVLAAVLDGYSGARLNKSLVQGTQEAVSVGASYDMTGRGPSLFYLEGTPAKGKTVDQLEKDLLAQVKKVADDGISEQELERVKSQLMAGQVYKRDSVFGQAMEIGQTLTLGFKVEDIDRMIDQMKTVTRAEVQDVAKRYFDTAQMTVGTLYPLPIDPNKKQAPAPSGMLH